MSRSNIDFFTIEGNNVVSETYGKLTIEQYIEVCKKNDMEMFNEFYSEPTNRMIFTSYYDELARLDDKRLMLKHEQQQCIRVTNFIDHKTLTYETQ